MAVVIRKPVREYRSSIAEVSQKAADTEKRQLKYQIAQQIARNLLRENVPIHAIVRATGLTMEQLQRLEAFC